MGWLIVLAAIVILAVLPLGVSAVYDADGPLLRLIAGPIRIKLYPRPSGKKKKEAPKEEKPKQKKAAKPTEKKKQTGGSVSDFFPLVRVVFDLLKDFRRKLRVNVLELRVTLAGGDPSDLAVNYGKACAAITSLEPQLERFFVIKKKSLRVEPDFTSDSTLIYARLDLTITLGRLIALLVRYGFRALREFLKIMKLRKGGAIQ